MADKKKIEYVVVADLQVDLTYQRSMSALHAQKLARTWDWNACEPITVSERDDGSQYIIDGRHRSEALKLIGAVDEIHATVLRGLTPAQEAELYYTMNSTRKGLVPVERFKAAVASGQEPFVSVANGLKKRGLSVSTSKSSSAVGCAGVIIRHARRFDADTVLRAVDVAINSWGREKESYDHILIDALCYVVGWNKTTYDADRLARKLRLKAPFLWGQMSQQLTTDRSSGGKGIALANAIVNDYNKSLRKNLLVSGYRR